MLISEIIKTRRSELNLTLNDIAKKVGVSEATVQRWESGNIKNLRHSRIVKLAEVLQIHPAALMGWDAVDKDIPRLYDELGVEWIDFVKEAKNSGLTVEQFTRFLQTLKELK